MSYTTPHNYTNNKMMIIWQTVPLDTIMLLQHCSCLGLSFSSSFSEKFPLSWWPLIPPTNLVTPGEICERQAMLIHHQFSERLRNYIFFLPSKYWVSHLFVRLGGQATGPGYTTINTTICSFKGGVGGTKVPKIVALPEGGGSFPLARIFWSICPQCHCQCHLSPKSDNFPPKVCPYSPE